MALDKITTDIIADDAVTAAKIVAGAVDADIRDGAVTPSKIPYFENATNTQNLSGTYSTERMYLNDSYTLTGDVTVTGHLALSTLAGTDVVITQDSTERTITGSGTIEAGRLVSDIPSLTEMTGELGSVVTGSPNLNLTTGTLGSGVTFPAGHILQVQHTHKLDTWITYQTSQNNGMYVPDLNVTITPSSTSNKILVMVELNVSTEHQGNGLQMWVDRQFAKVTTYAGAAVGSRGRVITGTYAWGGESGDIDAQTIQMTGSFVDTPASIATLNYAVVLWVKNNNTWFYVNRLETDSDNADHPRMASSIIAMEIQG